MSPAAATAPVATGRSLDGVTTLVTGAGRGLGRGIAEALAAAGAEVVLVARSRDELGEVAAAIAARGGAAHAAPCDVTDVEQLAAVIEGLAALDVLVNNAGTNEPQPFTSVSEDSFDCLVTLNLRATFFASQAAARAMIARRIGGSIITVSSQMGHVGAANRSVYCATEHAVEGLTKALAVELAPHGIRVNTVAPTYVRTPMTEPFLADEAFAADVLGRIPLGRLGEVADVAAAVTFLASPEAALITGTSLLIDGGYTAQ